MSAQKPIASLSMDLDNEWSYLKTHGDSAWTSFPTYLDTVVPRVLSFLKERGLTITFFIVGQDADRPENREALRAIAAAGHEIANHSYHHEPWLGNMTETEIDTEVARAEECIQQATGQQPIGFRGPGYCYSSGILGALQRRGYVYDASTLPTFLGPLARAYYFMTASLSSEEKQERAQLFGTLRDGLRPIRPYRWCLEPQEGDGLLEIPVTTLPLFRFPFHFSYILYVSSFSPGLARLYFGVAMAMCCLAGTQPSLLLHPLDFLDGEDVPSLAFFPALELPRAKKLAVINDAIEQLSRRYEVLTLQQHADRLQNVELKVEEVC
jgi:peptidoglycan/xylan/chitin deacetylase (PgdA/CDA1 family)